MKAYVQKVQIGEHDLVGKLIFTRIRRIALLSDLDCEIANAHAQCQFGCSLCTAVCAGRLGKAFRVKTSLSKAR